MGNAPARDQLAGEKIPEIASGYNVFYAYDHAQNRLYKENNIRGSRDTFSYETANKMANMKSVLGFHHAPSRSTSTGIRFLVLHGRLVKQSRNGAELSACVRAAAHPRLRGGTAPKPGCCERSIVAVISHLTSNMQDGTITWHCNNAQTTSAPDSARGEQVRFLADRSRSARPVEQGRSNKLVRIEGSGFTNEFVYDSMQRRIAVGLCTNGSSLTWRYTAHDGTLPMAEMTNGAMTRCFARGAGVAEGTGDMIAEILQNTNAVFYLANHRGDTMVAYVETDNSRNLAARYCYDAFGNVTSSIINDPASVPRFTFSTKEYLAEAQLYLYAYRVYDPVAGRWTQRDPIDYQDSANLYQFCGNNPVCCTDPSGRAVYGNDFIGPMQKGDVRDTNHTQAEVRQRITSIGNVIHNETFGVTTGTSQPGMLYKAKRAMAHVILNRENAGIAIGTGSASATLSKNAQDEIDGNLTSAVDNYNESQKAAEDAYQQQLENAGNGDEARCWSLHNNRPPDIYKDQGKVVHRYGVFENGGGGDINAGPTWIATYSGKLNPKKKKR